MKYITFFTWSYPSRMIDYWSRIQRQMVSHEWSLGAKSGSRKWDYILWYFPQLFVTIDRTDRDTKVNIVFSSIIFSIDTIRCTCYNNKVPFIGRCRWGYWVCNLHPLFEYQRMKSKNEIKQKQNKREETDKEQLKSIFVFSHIYRENEI